MAGTGSLRHVHKKGCKNNRGLPVSCEGRASKWSSASCSAGMRNPGLP